MADENNDNFDEDKVDCETKKLDDESWLQSFVRKCCMVSQFIWQSEKKNFLRLRV